MDFKDPVAVIWSRKWLVLLVIVVGIGAGVAAFVLSGPQYEATSSVAILGQNDAGHDSVANAVDMPTLLTSDEVLTRFETAMHWHEPLSNLRKRISANIDMNSSLMPIEFRAPTRDEAVAGANSLADSLQQTYRRISLSRYDDLSNYLSGALNRERGRIDDSDRQLAQLVAKNPYEAQKEAAMAISGQIIALNSQRSSLEASLESADDAAALANQRMDAIQPLVRTEVLQSDANYHQLEQQVAQASTQRDVARSQFTSEYPGLPGLNDEVQRTQGMLQQEATKALARGPGESPTYAAALKDQQNAQNSVSTAQQQLVAVDSQLEDAQSHLSNLPNVGVRIDALRLQRDAAENAYQIFAEQRSITLAQQAEAAALGSVVVAGYASEAQPALGRATLLMPIAALFGFMVIAFTLPFALEMIAPRMRKQTIETLYGKPVIVTVAS
jgi:uncharacterized protein involved in exopolysaccharide biosynthesis